MKDLFTYGNLDMAKIIAQGKASTTDLNFAGEKFLLLPSSRGESALVIAADGYYLALVQEGLGTKNLVAEKMGASLESSAWDTVAMIVNDLITSGAHPLAVNAHWAVGSNSYLTEEKARQLARGWAAACSDSGAIYGAGETPALTGIVKEDTIELSGSGVGIIKPKKQLVTEEKLRVGDHIILVSSSGIHANGLTDARLVAERLNQGYETKFSTGQTYGQALLTPTTIYSRMVKAIQGAGADIHYLVNITGHGWRKLMRAVRDFTYMVHTVPALYPEFRLIAETLKLSDRKMYERFNMGAGFAVYVAENEAEITLEAIRKAGYSAYDGGVVCKGPKQVIIKPKGIVYDHSSLKIR
jgi:phosphoribosylformylglycinamidine cyclo-ligase